MDKARGDQLDHEGVVVVHCKLVVLPCEMFDRVDRVDVVDMGVGGLLKILREVLVMGGDSSNGGPRGFIKGGSFDKRKACSMTYISPST